MFAKCLLAKAVTNPIHSSYSLDSRIFDAVVVVIVVGLLQNCENSIWTIVFLFRFTGNFLSTMEKRLKTASKPRNIQHTFIASLRATKANNKLPIVMKTKCNPWIYIVYTVYILYMYWVSIEPAKRKAIRHAILESTRTAVIFLQLKQTSFSTYSRLWSCLLSHLSAERLRLVKEKVGKCMLNKCGNRNFSSDCRDRFKLFMHLIFVAFSFF